MTSNQIVGLFVRLFAVWLAFQALQMVGISFALGAQDSKYTVVPAYGIVAILFISAVGLWLCPMLVAHKLIPRTHGVDALHVPASEAAVVAVCVLGLWLLVGRAIPGLTQFIVTAAMYLGSGHSLSELSDSRRVQIVLALIEVVVALFFIFRAHKVAAYLLATRGGRGVERAGEKQSASD